MIHKTRCIDAFALTAKPNSARIYNSLSWFFAASPDSKVLDGERAVKMGEKAVALKPEDYRYLDTLAAAYARAGQFDQAVKTQKRAITLMEKNNIWAWILSEKKYQERLAFYRDNKAWVD